MVAPGQADGTVTIGATNATATGPTPRMSWVSHGAASVGCGGGNPRDTPRFAGRRPYASHMSMIAAAQWTAVAIIALAVFAVVTAVFASLAYRKQSKEVRTLEAI